MKSYTYKALAAAAAAVCGTSAFAGSMTVTQRDFALEAITNSTSITLPNVVLTIGVGRTSSQDFTVVVKPVNSATEFNGSCPLPTFSDAAATGAATVSVKRASASECAYEVDVTTGFNASNGSLTFSGLQFSKHSLATEGNTESVKVGVWELAENARVDNSVDLTNVVAKSWRAVTLTADKDTATTADVLYSGGDKPLFGFKANGDDTAEDAKASFTVGVNGSLTNAGGASFNAHTDVTKITFTVTGDYDGLQTNFAASNSAVQVSGGAELGTVTVSGTGSAATAVFSVNGTALNATGNTTVSMTLATAGTKSLGTSRAFGVKATVDPALSGVADQNLAGNTEWWVWTANAVELRSAFFNNDVADGSLTRFFFQNLGSKASYTAKCYAESDRSVVEGTAIKGDLNEGTTAINASDICTFTKGTRGSIVFTINTAANKIKGIYQQAINGKNASYIPLDRPYNTNSNY